MAKAQCSRLTAGQEVDVRICWRSGNDANLSGFCWRLLVSAQLQRLPGPEKTAGPGSLALVLVPRSG